MKTKSILALALVLMSSAVFATESIENKFAVITGKESGIYKVIYEGKTFVRATVSVTGKGGKEVFSQEVMGRNGFILPMNFTALSSGEYTIIVKHGQNSWKHTVNHTEVSPVVKNSSIQNVHISKFNDGKYMLSISTLEEQFVRVNIFDMNNSLLHTETRKADGGLAVVYNVKNATGEVKFQITDKAGYSTVIKK